MGFQLTLVAGYVEHCLDPCHSYLNSRHAVEKHKNIAARAPFKGVGPVCQELRGGVTCPATDRSRIKRATCGWGTGLGLP